MNGYKILHEQSSIWNSLTQQHQKRGLEAMDNAVKHEALESSILSQAKDEFETQVRKIASRTQAEVTFLYVQ